MIKRSSLAGVAHDIGDTKTRYAPSFNLLDTAVLPFNGQEWLRTGYLIPYAAKYAAQLSASIGRGLYAYDGVAEQGVSTNGANAKAQATVDYYGGRYYFFPDYNGVFAFQSKSAFDNSATQGTASSGMTGGVNITEMRGFFIIKTGANAGRAILTTNGNTSFKVLYQNGGGTFTGVWSDANGGTFQGGDGRIIMGKPDGSVICILADTLGSAYGSPNIKVSVNGGTAWTGYACNLATAFSVLEGAWCPSLNKFVVIGGSGGNLAYYTTPDGYTFTLETGAAMTANLQATNRATCLVADNGNGTFVVGNTSNLYRSLAGGAFASVATPRQLVGIVAAGANLYALNSSNGLELSTDNGTTWTYLGQVNGPQPGVTSGGNVLLRVANGNLFISSGVSFMRFPLQPLPGLTPDRIGTVYAVQVPSGQTNAATFIRIL